LLSAWRGTGKTLFGLSMAVAVASGGVFLGWQAPKTRRVLYVDGEMCVEDVKEYMAAVAGAIGREWDENLLQIITPDLQVDGFASIQTRAGQEMIEDHLGGTELLVCDNLISLADARAESDPEIFDNIKTWQLKLRRDGIANVLMHHVGKGWQPAWP
ncbi:helicase RepA family protein, partial [bacterium]|nr:helicase RepA family protein [bacterium]